MNDAVERSSVCVYCNKSVDTIIRGLGDFSILTSFLNSWPSNNDSSRDEKSLIRFPLLQSCKQSSRLSPQQQPPATQDEEPNGVVANTSKKHRVAAIRIGGGGIAAAANAILVFHLLLAAFAAMAAEAAASASSSSQSQSPFRFRFADSGGGLGGGGGGGSGGLFRWKRWEVAPTEANNADLLVRKLKRSTFDDLDCRGMYDQVSERQPTIMVGKVRDAFFFRGAWKPSKRLCLAQGLAKKQLLRLLLVRVLACSGKSKSSLRGPPLAMYN